MSQSILISDIESYQYKLDKDLISAAYEYTLKKRFDIGKELNFNKINYLRLMNSAICNNELTKFIEKKILGQLEECNIKVDNTSIGYLKKYCDDLDGQCGLDGCELRIQW